MNHQLDIFREERKMEAHRISSVYFNSTEKEGAEIQAAQQKASGQTERVLRFFRDNANRSWTPWEVYDRAHGTMITSIRRAITTLTDAGYLVKTGEKRKSGPAHESNYTWRLK